MLINSYYAVMTIWAFMPGMQQVAVQDVEFINYYQCELAQQELLSLSLPANITLKTSCNALNAKKESYVCHISADGSLPSEDNASQLVTFSFSEINVSITSRYYNSMTDCKQAQSDLAKIEMPSGFSTITACLMEENSQINTVCEYV